MKEKMNQLFKDKLTLVMLVLGLLTIVSAAGVATLERKHAKEESPYLGISEDSEHSGGAGEQLAGGSDLNEGSGLTGQEKLAEEGGLSQGTGLADSGQGTATGGRERKESSNTGKHAGEAKNGQETGSGASGGKVTGLENAQSGTGNAQPGTEKSLAEQSLAEAELPLADAENLAEPAGADHAVALALNFADTASLLWPVAGNVLLDYNMENTIYFPTLEEYKCNPGIVIQGEVDQPVTAPANARVLEAGTNEEIGTYLVLDLGDSYTLTCGQLKDVTFAAGAYIARGQVLGYVADPTKYYSIEGPNVFLELQKDGKAVDPLDFLE